jgi:hypothetical protein
MWSLLLLTLPSQPNAVRLRIWRNLKALGCAALRDGAYVLPASHAAAFEALAGEVREHDGSASVLELAPRDEAQRREVLALFDRSEAYAAWHSDLRAQRAALGRGTEATARRRLRQAAEALMALQAIDYYPGPAAAQAEQELQSLRSAIDARFAPGEPKPRGGGAIRRLQTRDFQGKRWVSRTRPWADRLACAWLIRRFIDAQATVTWLAEPARAPRQAIGFDFDGARFAHVGARVTFEVMLASFGLDADPPLQRIAQAVHYIDVGGIPCPEAAGLEAVLAGLRALHADDDLLAAAAAQVFDALYAAPVEP